MGLVDAIQNLFKKKKTSNNSERKNNGGTGTKTSASFSSTSAKKVTSSSTHTYQDLGRQVNASLASTKKPKSKSNTTSANRITRNTNKANSDQAMKNFTDSIAKSRSSSPMNTGVVTPNKGITRKEAESRMKDWGNLGSVVSEAANSRNARIQQYKNQGMTESQIIHQLKKDADYSNTGNAVYDKLHNFSHGANEVINKAAEGVVNSAQSLVNSIPQAAQVAKNGRNDNAERNAILRSYMDKGYSPAEAKKLAEQAQLTHSNDTDIIDSSVMDAINKPFDNANEYLEGISNDYQTSKNLSDTQRAVVGHVANVAQNATNNITNMVAGAALSAATGGLVNPATAGLVTMGMNSYGNTFAADVREQRQAAAQQVYDYIISKGGTPDMAAKWYNYYLENAQVDIKHANTRAVLDAANEELQEQISPFGSNITQITPGLTDLAMEGVQEGVGTLLDPYNDIITANVHDTSKIPEQMLAQLKTDVGLSGDKEATADRWKDVGKSAAGGVESALVLGGITNPVETYNSLKNDVKNVGAAVTGRDSYTSDLMARETDKNIKVAEDAVKMGNNSESAKTTLNNLYDQKMDTDQVFFSKGQLNSEDYNTRESARKAATDYLKTSAKRYGVKNESLVNDISAISDKLGVVVKFTDNLADNIDGKYEDGIITISSKANNTATVFSHELTHALENSDSYSAYASQVEQLANDGVIDYGYDSIDELKDAIKKTYGSEVSDNVVNSEVTARLTENLFGNETAIKRLVVENRNAATRVLSWINDTIQSIGSDRQTRELIKAKRLFEAALNNPGLQMSEYERMRTPIEDGGRAERVNAKTYISKDQEGHTLPIYEIPQNDYEWLASPEANKYLSKMLSDKYKGKEINIGGMYNASVSNSSIGHLVYPHTRISDELKSAKRTTFTDFEALTSTAEFMGESSVYRKDSHEDAKSFDYFTVRFGIDTGNGIIYWDAKLNIRHSTSGDFVTDVTDVKRSGSNPVGGNTLPTSTASTNNIADGRGIVNAENVNNGNEKFRRKLSGNEKVVVNLKTGGIMGFQEKTAEENVQLINPPAGVDVNKFRDAVESDEFMDLNQKLIRQREQLGWKKRDLLNYELNWLIDKSKPTEADTVLKDEKPKAMTNAERQREYRARKKADKAKAAANAAPVQEQMNLNQEEVKAEPVASVQEQMNLETEAAPKQEAEQVKEAPKLSENEQIVNDLKSIHDAGDNASAFSEEGVKSVLDTFSKYGKEVPQDAFDRGVDAVNLMTGINSDQIRSELVKMGYKAVQAEHETAPQQEQTAQEDQTVSYADLDTDASVEAQLKSYAKNGSKLGITDFEQLYNDHSSGEYDSEQAAKAMQEHYNELLSKTEKVQKSVKETIKEGGDVSQTIKENVKEAATEEEKQAAVDSAAKDISDTIIEHAEKLSGEKLDEDQKKAAEKVAKQAAESEKADAEYEQKAEQVKKEQEKKNKGKAEEDKTNVTDSVEITDAYRSALKSYSIPQAFKKVIMDIFKNKDSVTHERIVHEVISNEDMIAVGEKNWAELGVAGVRKLAEEYNTDKNSSSKASPLSLEHEATLEVALVHMGQQMDSLQKAYEKFEDKMTADQKAEYQKIFNDYMNSYNVIFDSFANAGTNYGRLLQARKMLYKNKYARWAKYEKGMSQIAEKMGKDISDIMKGQKEKYDAAETDEQRDEILQETDKLLSQRLATRLDKMSQWRYTAMLCNPRTFIRNDVSNGLTYGMFRLSDWNSVVLEKAIKKVAGQDVTKSHVLKVKREYLDFSKQYISENGLNAAGETKYHEGQLRTDRAFSDNSKMGAVLNNISEWTSNKLNKSDDLFISMRASNYLAQQLQAGGYTLKEGKLFKKGKELTEAQQNSALAKMGARAYRSAMEATYHDASDLADAINKARKNSTAARVFLDAAMPFTKTPINIAKRSVEFSPVGFIKNVTYDYYQVKQGKMDANTFIENLSKGMTGTEMAAVGAWLAAQGILHGGGDDDKDKDETYYRGDIYGDQDYALYIGDYRVSLDWAMPSVSAACMGAQAFLDMKKRMDGGDMSFGDFMLGSAKALSTILDPIMSMTMFGTINDLMQTFVNNGDKVGALSAFLMSVGGNLVNQYVPTIFGALNRSFMSRKRYAYNTDLGKNYLNNILTRVPGAASVLPVTIDDNGNEVLNTGTIYGVKADEAFDSGENLGKYAVDSASRLFYNMLVPATITRSKKDNTSDELLRLKSQGQDVLPGNIYKIYGSLDEDGNYKEDIAITGSDLMNAKAIYAKEYKQYADAFIKSDMYTMMDQGTKSNDEFKGKVLKGLYNYAVDKARVDYFGEAGLKYDKVLKGTDKALFELEKKGVSPVTILAIRNSGLTGTERSYAARTVLDEAGALDTVRKLAEDGTINLSDVGLNKTVANMTDEEFSYAASHMEEKEKKEKALYNPEDLIEKERIQEVMNAAGVPDASLYSARYAESDKDRYGNNITYSQDINARKELGEENVEKIKEAVENGEMTMDEAAIYTSISKKVLSMDTESFNDFADNNVSNYETAMNTAMQIGVNTDNLLAAREATSDYDNTGATIKYSKGINDRKMLGEENVQKYKDAIAEGIITLDDAVKQTGISKSVFKLSTAAFNRKYGDYVYSPFGDTETAKAASKSYKSGRKKKGSGDSSDTDETGETIKTSKEAKEEEKKRLAALKAFAEAMSKGTKAVASASDKGLKNSMSELSKLTDQQIYQKVMSSKSLENKLGLKGIKIESSK